MLHKTPISLISLGRSLARRHGHLRLILVAMLLVMMSVTGTSLVNAQGLQVTFTPYQQEIWINEHEEFVLTVRATHPMFLPSISVSPGRNRFSTAIEGTAVVGRYIWQPDEYDGDDTQDLKFLIMVGMGTTQSETYQRSVRLVVREANAAPQLPTITSLIVNEANVDGHNQAVNFIVGSATDSDIPGQTLTYKATNLPSLASFDAETRQFKWLPGEEHGANTYNIDFTVTDNGFPPMSHTQSMAIVVNEFNDPPKISPIGDKSVDAAEPLTFFVNGSDSDLPEQTLVYWALNLPAGASIDKNSGEFTWQTTEADSGTQHEVTIMLTDNGVPAMTASETITITVNKVNNAPVLAHIPDVVGHPGQVVFMTISATDTDFPEQTLTYSMDGALDGMWLDSATGEFSWTITGGETFVPYGVTFTVTDNGEPQQSASQTVGFTIQEKNFLKNSGFQVAGKTAKQAQNWKGIGLLPGDKRVCKPSSEIIANEDICEFQFSATPANAKNRKLRQQLEIAEFTSGDLIEFSGFYEPKALTKGAKVQLVAKLADGKIKRATVKLSTEVSSNPEILNYFEGTLTLTAAPVSMWLEISTGKSSGKLLLDDLQVVILPPSPELELADAPAAPNAADLIPVPAAPDLRGGAAIDMEQ